MSRCHTLDAAAKLPQTPAFIIDKERIVSQCSLIRELSDEVGCEFLFTLKPLVCEQVISLIGEMVDGFSVSSSFEARLAREAFGSRGSVHLVTVALCEADIQIAQELCSHIVFNSLSQWERFNSSLRPSAECGIRVNPNVSLVRDQRYDPCRSLSKLGVSLQELRTAYNNDRTLADYLSGIHFHTNCDSADFSQLLKTVKVISNGLPEILESVDWINVGGGYLFAESANFDDFRRSIELLQKGRRCRIFIEPGATVVREAAVIVASVLDILGNGSRRIAVLDTTTNHMPEVFEYQFEPDVAEHTDDGEFGYILAGRSCLAGDIFGEYSFNKELRVGSRVVFENVGAYSVVKANMFNGINLPSIYALDETGRLELIRQFAFEDFASRFGFQSHEYANL